MASVVEDTVMTNGYEENYKTIYIMCPKCGELSQQYANEYPIVCCGIPGMTFGTGKCCRCQESIKKDPEQLDLCFTCRLSTMHINR